MAIIAIDEWKVLVMGHTDLTFISEYNHSNSVANGEYLMIVQKKGIRYREVECGQNRINI